MSQYTLDPISAELIISAAHDRSGHPAQHGTTSSV